MRWDMPESQTHPEHGELTEMLQRVPSTLGAERDLLMERQRVVAKSPQKTFCIDAEQAPSLGRTLGYVALIPCDNFSHLMVIMKQQCCYSD